MFGFGCLEQSTRGCRVVQVRAAIEGNRRGHPLLTCASETKPLTQS